MESSISEMIPLCEKQEVYLKPLAKLEITVKLPKITVPGQSISNWDLMERLKKTVNPIQLDAIRVRESSLEGVIFEAELPSKSILKKAQKQLDGISMKVSGFAEPLKVKTAEAKSDFPSRHDWDLFYMKNKMDESKPGERPDTVYLAKVPVKWFNDGILDGPSASLLKNAMKTYGPIRKIDIPACDPLRIKMTPKIAGFQSKGFGFGQDVLFEAYVQYDEYQGFLAAMAGLRNMKWAKRIDGKLFLANVKVDFDRTRHLSDVTVQKRENEREKMLTEEKRLLRDKQMAIEAEENKKLEDEREKERRRDERERRRKEKKDEERRLEEEVRERDRREKEEIRKAKQTQILQAHRLMTCVFDRIQGKEDRRRRDEEARLKADLKTVELDEIAPKEKEDKLREALLIQREMRMRERLKEKMQIAASSKRMSKEDASSDSDKEDERRSSRHRKKKTNARHDHSKGNCLKEKMQIAASSKRMSKEDASSDSDKEDERRSSRHRKKKTNARHDHSKGKKRRRSRSSS